MSEPFSLRDHLFNAESLGDLAGEFERAVPGFSQGFLDEVLPGLAARGLLERLDWIADCVEKRLSPDFPTMADQLERALPDPLDPGKSDGDFGRFIHGVPGVLAVRRGLDDHPERALDLLHAATQRFSMELYIRTFLNRWPELTLARLAEWVEDPNYHVRRLVSEGTRPRLPWAANVDLPLDAALPLLDALHGDQTRYVTRSVANHLNDIAKKDPDIVLERLRSWQAEGRQSASELDWMTRHALRSLIKSGHPGALKLLGYDPGADLEIRAFSIAPDEIAIDGVGSLSLRLFNPSADPRPVLIDYVITFATQSGKPREKVFKWKQAVIAGKSEAEFQKSHRFKGNATTFTLWPGPHEVTLQVNGRRLSSRSFALLPPATGLNAGK